MEKCRVNYSRIINFCINRVSGNARLITIFIVLTVLAGCDSPAPSPVFLIKAGNIMVTHNEFAQELDLKLTAYPYDIRKTPGEYNTMVLDLVSTLSEETVLLAAAKEKGIDVPSEELSRAEKLFRKDYPENSFEQMLLENAISYTVWKNRFKKDMVIDKLIQQDLVDVQEITPEDMVAFYKRLDNSEVSEKSETLDEAGLVEQLRMEKSQASYEQWIQGLKTACPLEIDKKSVAVFLMNRE